MYRWIVPSSSRLRVMLSSQRLCPRSWRASVAFTGVLPGLLRLSLAGGGHAIACDLGYLVRGETELDEQLLQGGRRAEGMHPDHGAAVADVAVPAQGRRLLHRYASPYRGQDHLVA